MPDLKSLLGRLEKSPLPYRYLDAEIWDLEDPRPRESIGNGEAIYKRDPHDPIAFDSAPHFTASLDAAVALQKRVLCGWTTDDHTADGSAETYPIRTVLTLFWDGNSDASILYEHPHREAREIVCGNGSTPAIALCAAIVRALIVRGDGSSKAPHMPEPDA